MKMALNSEHLHAYTQQVKRVREKERERQIESTRDEKKDAFKSRSDTAHYVCSKGLFSNDTKIFPISKTEMSHRTKRIDNNRLIALLSFHFKIFAYPFGILFSVRSYFCVLWLLFLFDLIFLFAGFYFGMLHNAVFFCVCDTQQWNFNNSALMQKKTKKKRNITW